MATRKNVLTGWRGLVECFDPTIGTIRFRNESINVPLAVNVDDALHSGMRVPSVYSYGLVKPQGNLDFPLMSDDPTAVLTGVDLNTATKAILNRAVLPQEYSTDLDSMDMPILDSTSITIHRGDSMKVLYEPWIDQIKISSTSGSTVDVSLSLKSIFGEVITETISDMPDVTFGKSRAIMFNELNWTSFVNDVSSTILTDSGAYPRAFDLTISNGIKDDDTPNTDENFDRIQQIRALRGFALGYQKVEFNITFVGKALPGVSGIERQYSIPFDDEVDIGGLYIISGGIVTERSLDVPGNEDLAITKINIRGMGDSSHLIPASPGALIQ